MKFFIILFEYLAGIVGLIVSLFTLGLGGILGLGSIPRYLRISGM